MQKRPWLIAAFATVLWLGIWFCLGGAKAESARSPAVVMLGDSITAAADWNALLPSFDVANRGTSGDTTEDVLGRIENIVAMHPRCVAVMIGVNDLLKKRNVQQVLKNYAAIVENCADNQAVVYTST